MQEPVTYRLDHATSTVELSLTPERFVVNTQGKGALDRLKTIDIPLSEIQKFTVVPAIVAQTLTVGEGVGYDAEFIFSYSEEGRIKHKRVFVAREDAAFQRLIERLQRTRPDASLLHLPPEEAQAQIGVLSASKALPIIIGVIVGIPLLIMLIVLLSTVLGG